MLHVKHETVPGHIDGYVSYRVEEERNGALAANQVQVLELLAADPQTYADLWAYLLSLDLTRGVAFERARVDEPVRWLSADPRAVQVDGLFDYLWLGLLDLPRALAARSYGTRGTLVLEVTQTFPTPGRLRVVLRVDGSEAHIESAPVNAVPAGQAPGPLSQGCDLQLDVSTLSTAYLGGVSFATLAAAGRVRESRPGAAARADAMFTISPAPYCATMF